MSVSGDSLFTRPYRPTLFEVLRAEQPGHGATADQYVEHFAHLLEQHHQTIAGVIIEPLIQAAGGMVMWPKEALQTIAVLCARYQVILIFDEVMTGFGRTGSLFAMDQLGVTPDLVCLSKGLTGGTLPLAVTMVSEEIYRTFLSNEKTKMLFHGHSFTGNPMACAAAVANIELFAEEKTLERVQTIASLQREHLHQLESRLPILNPRTCGAVAAFEVDTEVVGYASNFSEKLSGSALEQGLSIRPLGNTVYLMPAYSATPSDLDFAWGVLEKILN